MKRKQKHSYRPRFHLAFLPALGLFLALFSYFLFTFTEEDTLSCLTVCAPDADTFWKQFGEEPPCVIEIMLYSAELFGGSGFVINKRPVNLKQLDEKLAFYATINKDLALVFLCLPDVPHGSLIQALNLAYKNQMTNLTLLSIDEGTNGCE